jgi:hypothetical protein
MMGKPSAPNIGAKRADPQAITCEIVGPALNQSSAQQEVALIATSLRKRYCDGEYLQQTYESICHRGYSTMYALVNWELYRFNYFHTHFVQGRIQHAKLAALSDPSQITQDHVLDLINLTAASSFPYKDAQNQGKTYQKKNKGVLESAQPADPQRRVQTVAWGAVLKLTDFSKIFSEVCAMYFNPSHPLHTEFKNAVNRDAKEFVEAKEGKNIYAGNKNKNFNKAIYQLAILAFILEECAGLPAFGLAYKINATFYAGKILPSIAICLDYFVRNQNPQLMSWNQVKFSDEQNDAEESLTPPISQSPPKSPVLATPRQKNGENTQSATLAPPYFAPIEHMDAAPTAPQQNELSIVTARIAGEVATRMILAQADVMMPHLDKESAFSLLLSIIQLIANTLHLQPVDMLMLVQQVVCSLHQLSAPPPSTPTGSSAPPLGQNRYSQFGAAPQKTPPGNPLLPPSSSPGWNATAATAASHSLT